MKRLKAGLFCVSFLLSSILVGAPKEDYVKECIKDNIPEIKKDGIADEVKGQKIVSDYCICFANESGKGTKEDIEAWEKTPAGMEDGVADKKCAKSSGWPE